MFYGIQQGAIAALQQPQSWLILSIPYTEQRASLEIGRSYGLYFQQGQQWDVCMGKTSLRDNDSELLLISSFMKNIFLFLAPFSEARVKDTSGSPYVLIKVRL